MASFNLWTSLGDVGKGVGRFVTMPAKVVGAGAEAGYKALNVFTDIAQEYIGSSTGQRDLGPLGFLSDDEWEGSPIEILWGSVNDNILGGPTAQGGLVDKLIGPEGMGGEFIQGFPEWFFRQQMRDSVQRAGSDIDMVYRKAIQKPLGSAITVAKMAGVTPSANPAGMLGDLLINPQESMEVIFDTSSWKYAWEITEKRTVGQAVIHGIMTADILDPEQIRATEETGLFNLSSGIIDLGLVFYADPLKVLTPVVRTARLVKGTKGAMLHTMEQTGNRWNPIGEGGMFGPEGVVGSRYKITPEEFVETPRVKKVLDLIDEHAADLDFGPEHSIGFNGPQPLTMAETLRRMPNAADNVLSPDAAKVQTLAGRLMNDRRLTRLAGWTPDLAQALAIAPDAITRKFVLRLAMGDKVALEAVENAMRTWTKSQASGDNFNNIRQMQDELGAVVSKKPNPDLKLNEAIDNLKKEVDEGLQAKKKLEAEDIRFRDQPGENRTIKELRRREELQSKVRKGEEANVERARLIGTDPREVLLSGIEGATQRAIRELIELNPANAGSLFQVAYAMGHNQMGQLARTADDMLRSNIPLSIREAAGDATLVTAANDFVLAGIFSEAFSVNRTLFATLSDAPAIAVRRSLGRTVMNVVEPVVQFKGSTLPRLTGNRSFSPRRVIEVTREAVADHIMDFQNVDSAYRNWNAMIREAARVENGELLRLAMKKLNIVGDVDTMVGAWQPKSLSQRKKLFYDTRNALSESYVQYFSSKIDPKLLKRADESNLATGDYIDHLLFNIKGSIKKAEDLLRSKANDGRKYGTGDGVIIDGSSPNGSTYRRHVPISSTQLGESAVIPRYAYVKNLDVKNPLTSGIRLANGYLDWAMNQWKKSVLLRPGWPLRVLTDEELRAIATVGYVDQLANIGVGWLDYRTDLTRRRGIDTVTPAIKKIRERVQKQIDEETVVVPDGVTKADQLAPNELFDLAGAETVQEIFRKTAQEELNQSNKIRKTVWGTGGFLLAGPLGALASAGLYSRTARKTVQTVAIREAAEYFGFQMREVNVQQLRGEIEKIAGKVESGRITPELGAQQVTDLRHATELLQNQVATLDEVLEILHPAMGRQYEELLTNFDRSGLLMQDAGYQGFMIGPHGANNVFGNDPFEIDMSRKAASADGGRQSLTNHASQVQMDRLRQGYNTKEYKTIDFVHPGEEAVFARSWDETVNNQWTPNAMLGADEWVGDFQTYIKNLWRLSDDEMVAWLEAKRNTEFGNAFVYHYLDEAGQNSSTGLREWVEAARLEVDSIIPDLNKGDWKANFQVSREAKEAFDALRERAFNGERLSWTDDVMPEVRRIQKETQDGNSLFNESLNEYEVIEAIREGTNTNFGKIHTHSGMTEDLATAANQSKFTQFIDNSMNKLGTASVNHLSRNPLWKALYAKEGARRVQPFRNADGTYSITPKQHHDAMQAAKRASLKEMRDLLYELGKRTRFQEVVGNISPFFGAYQEVISKWSGIAVRNPIFVARGTRYYEMANDEEGRIHIDMSDWFGNPFDEESEKARITNLALGEGLPGLAGGWIQPLVANQVVKINPGSIMIWNASPGLSPGANYVIGEVSIKNPAVADLLEFLQPYGSSEASSGLGRLLENIYPTIIRRLPKSGSSSMKKMQGLVAQDLLGQYIRAGKFVDDENYDSIGYEFKEEVEKRSFKIMMFHAIAGATLPASISVQSPDYKLIEQYKNVQATYGFDKAVMWLLNTHPDYWNIASRRTKLVEGVAAYTQEGSAMKERHEQFANSNPSIGDFVLGEVGSLDSVTTFSYNAYKSALAEGNIERLSPTEVLTKTSTSVGWAEYRARMTPVNEKIVSIFQSGESKSMNFKADGNEDPDAMRTKIITELRGKYPHWYNDFESSQGSTVRRKVVASFTTMVNEHWEEFKYRPELRDIRDYLAQRWNIQTQLEERPDTGLRNEGNEDLFNKWLSLHQGWTASATFGPILARYFSDDFITNNTFAQTAPKGVG